MKVTNKIGGLAFTIGITMLASCGERMNQQSYQIMLQGLLKHSVPEISISTASHDEHIIFIDAREKNEYKVSHIKNAIWVGYKNFDFKQIHDIDKRKKIVVYCSIGYRSEKVAEKLIKAGYNNVSNLYGGIFEWVNVGNQVYRLNEPTNEVHAYNRMWSKWLRKGTKVYN